MATLVVCNWHTECGNCGYGRGGYMAAAAGKDTPPLGPDSEQCPGCGEKFTETSRVNTS